MGRRLWVIGLGGITLLGLFGVVVARRVALVARRSALAAAASSTATSRPVVPLQVAETAYDSKGGLGAGWKDWGWGPHELASSGPAKIIFAGYGGIVLRHAELAPSFGALSFRYKEPGDWSQFLAVRLRRVGGDSSSDFPQVVVEPRHVAFEPSGWREVLIDWSELDPNNLPVDGFSIAAVASVPRDWVLLDKVVLTKMEGPRTSRNVPTRDVNVGIDCSANSKTISPQIYGAAGGAWESGVSAQRLGGNPMTRLNWDANFWNAGNDWFFENGKMPDLPNWIEAGLSHAVPTALVVPMIGWVAKDGTSGGFPKSKFPKQRKFEPNRGDIGDGYTPDGTAIDPGAPSQTSVAAPPELIGRWVRAMSDQDRARGSRGVAMYILDNEPSLWSVTHRDVHPKPLGYDELLQRTIAYATEIRNADPGALIAGPAEWGWNGYMYSALDLATGASQRPDRLAHGDVPLVPWYLSQLAAQEHKTGKRLLDVLDLHFYPAAEGLYGLNARVDPQAAELRIRSTRALWDPTYRDETWIKESIRLIPRMKAWIAENYPGLKTSIGEWSFGADSDISGALATAEALGRFGQQGLDYAFYWNGPKLETGTFWAFRAYRNFDGKGGRFLDLSLSTRDADKVSLFASGDQAGTHIVAVLVNRDASFAVLPNLLLSGCGSVVSRRIFSYRSGSAQLDEAPASPPDTPFAIPPYSITVLDLHVQRP